jgi:hypothetical protein
VYVEEDAVINSTPPKEEFTSIAIVRGKHQQELHAHLKVSVTGAACRLFYVQHGGETRRKPGVREKGGGKKAAMAAGGAVMPSKESARMSRANARWVILWGKDPSKPAVGFKTLIPLKLGDEIQVGRTHVHGRL